jgi:uncharacterized Ntn-hydrolase superfamily protein
VTFSICVRESYVDEDGEDQTRYGVAVTTRLPGVGSLCPFASENGAIATQSLVNVDLGRRGVEYVDEGLAVDDALQALLNADDGSAHRQLHGVGGEETFAFSGEECHDWYGHVVGENYTVAGNLLTGESVVEAVADAYEDDAQDGGLDPLDADPLAKRLIDALAAGQTEGGDKREELPIQSAALIVETTEDREYRRYYNDLRVDATETPIRDLRETYAEARRGQDVLLDHYGEDEQEATTETDTQTEANAADDEDYTENS